MVVSLLLICKSEKSNIIFRKARQFSLVFSFLEELVVSLKYSLENSGDISNE
jgi:hypothetical protein